MSPPSPERDPRVGRDLLAALAVGALATAAFIPTFSFQFLNYDDPWQITENPYVRSLSAANLWHVLTCSVYQLWLPTKTISYALDYALWGLDPRGYHATNVLLHALASVLVFLVARRLLRERLWAVVAAALFALHPVHAEAVAWLSARKDVLSTVLLLVSVLTFFRWRTGGARRAWVWYGVSLLVFLLASRAKPTTQVLPVLLLGLVRLWPGGEGPAGGRLRGSWTLWGTLPFFVVAGVLSLVDWSLATRFGYATGAQAGRAAVNVPLVFWAYGWYARLLLLPVGLLPQYRVSRSMGLGEPAVLLGAALLLASVVLVVWALVKRWRMGAPLGWYLVAVLPVCGLLPIAVPSPVADRYLYLPSVGACILAAYGLESLARRLGGLGHRVLVGAVVVVLVALGLQTVHQEGVWADSQTLWQNVLAKDPRNYNAHVNLGAALFERGDYEGAEEHYLWATELAPGMLHAYLSLGSIAMKQGDLEAARRWLTLAVTSPAASVLTRAKITRTREKAAGQLRLVERMKRAQDRFTVAKAALARGKREVAKKYLRQALDEQPDLVEASLALSALLREQGRPDEALATIDAALELSPDDAALAAERERVVRALGQSAETGEHVE